MKRIGFFVLILALLSVSGCMEGTNKENGNKTTVSSVSEPQVNQDGEWIALVYASGSYLYSDMIALSKAAKSMDIASLKDASTVLKNHAAKALELSQGYKVSPKYNTVKDEYESALEDYRRAAVHMGNGADNAYTDTAKAKEEIASASNYMTSGTNYINQAVAELDRIIHPVRKLTFDIGEGKCAINSTGPTYGHSTVSMGSKIKNTYNTELDSSNPEYLVQKTYGEFTDSGGERAGFVEINVTTFKESLSSSNEKKLLSNALDFAIKSRNKKSISEKKTYKATLSNGQTIAVHEMYSPSVGFYGSSADVFSFMPDNKTIVTVLSSASGDKTAKLIKTLKIDDPPSFS